LESLSVHIAFEVTEQSEACQILNLRDVLEENDDSDELEELVRSVVLSFVPQQDQQAQQQTQDDQAMEDEITEIDDLYGDTLDEKKKKRKKKKKSSGKKDACYHKVKSRYKVWPSAYASGALVKCRKVGAKNWGNSKKEHLQSIIEDEIARDILLEKKKKKKKGGKKDGKGASSKGYSLRDWFKGGGWVQTGGKYDGKPCAKQPGQKTKPYCRDPDDRARLSKKERDKRAAKKRKEDPNPNRRGKAKNVSQTKKSKAGKKG